MTRIRLTSLRVRLLILVFLAAAPLVGVALHQAAERRQTAAVAADERALEVARTAAAHYAQVIDGTRRVLDMVANLVMSGGGHRETCDASVRDLLKQHRRYVNLGAVRWDGAPMCTAYPLAGLANVRVWFRRSLLDRTLSGGDYHTDSMGGKPALVLGSPILDPSGRVRGVAFAAVDPAWLATVAARASPPAGTVVALLDRRGTIVARHPDPEQWVGQSFPGAPVTAGIGVERETARELRDVDGDSRRYAFVPLRPIAEIGLSVAVGRSAKLALAEADGALRRDLAILGVAAALALGATWTAGILLILRPLRALASTSQRLSAGDLNAGKPSASSVGEVGQVERALDRMADTLQWRRAKAQEAEEALRESEARYRCLIEGSIQGIYVQKASRIGFANTAMARIFGYDNPGQLVGQDSQILVAPGERTRLEMHRAALLAGRETPPRYEYQGLRRDGTLIWIECLVSVVSWDGGPAILGTFLDISERKRAEEALREQEGQLRQAHKMEAVGRLAGGIAHDFNNLLTVIRGRSEILLRRLAPDIPWRQDIDLIEQTAERAAALTRQLLAFSRKQVLQPKVLELNAVVAGMDPILRRLIGEHIELVWLPGSALSCVRADPGQLEQVVMNLVVNARDAMPRGGRLTLETGSVELDDAFVRRNPGARAGTHVMLAVTDTGVGMNEFTKAHLFEPFFTTRGRGKGTGLGLATVYGIVRQSGGYIHVESELGRGATFRIYLPRVEAVAEDVEPSPPAARPLEGRETVLLVEDEDTVRGWAREVLDMYGYTVLEASNGIEALGVAERHDGGIHLLLTDVVMPHMSGRELADRLSPMRPEMKVLYMSGYTDEAIVHHGVLTAGTALIQKPFGVDALAEKVREVLGMAEAQTV